MYYYDPETTKIKTKRELSIELNASIPNEMECVNNYHRIHKDDCPVITSYQSVTENPIQLIDGQYRITYSVVYKPIETIREMKYREIEEKFQRESSNAWIVSSCGFKINAGEVANRDVEGLIKIMEAEGYDEESFKDYDNNFHTVTLSDLKKMQLEIIKNAQNLYKQKWKFIQEITELTTERDVSLYAISYTNMDFSNDE